MNRTRFGLIAGLMAMLLLFSGCSQNDSVDSVSGATQKGESQSSVDSTDTASSASLYFYEQGSLTGEELMTAIRNAEGSCSVATVNADGSPNLANFVPYPAGEEYLAFTFSSNVTKEKPWCPTISMTPMPRINTSATRVPGSRWSLSPMKL